MDDIYIELLLVAFYFLPTILAFLRRHPNLRIIFFFNLFLGLGFGMCGAYYFALSKRKPGTSAWIIFFSLNVFMMLMSYPGFKAAVRHSNDAVAKSNLTELWSTFEEYAKNHEGNYPPDLISLTSSTTEEVNDLCGKTVYKYNYDCSLSKEGYRIIVSPKSDKHGNLIYTLTTGGGLSEKWFHNYGIDKTYFLESAEN